MTKRKDIDWEEIEKEYRTGIMSVRHIADQYGVTHVAILKKAQKLGWKRDLEAEVRKKLRDKLVTDQVTGNRKNMVSEEIVEGAANTQFSKIKQQQDGIERHRRIQLDLIKQLASLPNDDDVGLVARKSIILKDLTQVSKTLIELEDKKHGLADRGIPLSDLERLLPPSLFESLLENVRGQLGE